MRRSLIALVLGLAFLSCEVSNPVAPPETPTAGGGASGGSGGASAGSGSPDFEIVIVIASADQTQLLVGGDAVDITITIRQVGQTSPVGLTYSISTSLGELLDIDDGTFKQLIEGVLGGSGTEAVLVTKFKPGDQAGSADVLVNVGNTVGTAQFEITVPVPVEPAVADFAVQQSDLRVLFTSSATGSEPIRHRWDFGDGCAWEATGTGADGLEVGDCATDADGNPLPGCSDCGVSDPVHDYSGPGAYAVKLVVQNQPGLTDDKTQLIDVGTLPAPAEPPVAMFTFEPQPGGLTVIFQDASSGLPTSWLWDFGDGNGNGENGNGGCPECNRQNPVHTFPNAGEFTVSLTVNNSTNEPSTTTQFVPVGTDIPDLKADFTFDVSASGLTVTFTDTSTGEPDGYLWEFGDGDTSAEQNPIHEYLSADEYQVKLTVSKEGVAPSTAQKLVAAGAPPPKANFTFSCNMTDPDTNMETDVCQGLTVVFNDTSTNDPTKWTWDFDDGTALLTCTAPDTSCRNPVHTYAVSGSYGVRLEVENTGGADNTTKLVGVDSGETQPDARFTFEKIGGLTVDFRDQSLGNPTTYAWDFNDPDSGPDNTSSNANPIHTFSTAGDYNVMLTVSNGEGVSSTSQFVRFSAPNADFGFTQVDQKAFFTDQSTGGPVIWEWDFGDGTTLVCDTTKDPPDAACPNPENDYSASGPFPKSFDVTLKITTAAPDSLTDQVTKTITIEP